MWPVLALTLLLGQAPPHECDVVPAVSDAVKADESFAVGFCALDKDADGAPLTVGWYRIVIDGVQADYAGPLQRGATPNAQGWTLFRTANVLKLPAGKHDITVTLINGNAPTQPESTAAMVTVTILPATSADACAAPFGADAIAIYVTRWDVTSGVPGSKMRVNYQFTSKTPIVEVQAKIDTVTVARKGGPDIGTDLSADGGIWFVQPPFGAHKLTVFAKNAAHCTREVFAPDLVILR